MYVEVQVNLSIFKQGNSQSFCLPSEKGSILILKVKFTPHGNKFIPFRVDPFSKQAWCLGT